MHETRYFLILNGFKSLSSDVRLLLKRNGTLHDP